MLKKCFRKRAFRHGNSNTVDDVILYLVTDAVSIEGAEIFIGKALSDAWKLDLGFDTHSSDI